MSLHSLRVVPVEMTELSFTREGQGLEKGCWHGMSELNRMGCARCVYKDLGLLAI